MNIFERKHAFKFTFSIYSSTYSYKLFLKNWIFMNIIGILNMYIYLFYKFHIFLYIFSNQKKKLLAKILKDLPQEIIYLSKKIKI